MTISANVEADRNTPDHNDHEPTAPAPAPIGTASLPWYEEAEQDDRPSSEAGVAGSAVSATAQTTAAGHSNTVPVKVMKAGDEGYETALAIAAKLNRMNKQVAVTDDGEQRLKILQTGLDSLEKGRKGMRLADIPLDPVDPIDPTGALVELVRAVRSYIVEPEPENGSKREVDPRISRQRLGELQSRYYPEHGDPRRMALQSLLWLARGFISRPGGEG